MKIATTSSIIVLSALILTAAPLLYTLFTGDFPGSTAFYGLQEDDQIVDRIFTVREFFIAR